MLYLTHQRYLSEGLSGGGFGTGVFCPEGLCPDTITKAQRNRRPQRRFKVFRKMFTFKA